MIGYFYTSLTPNANQLQESQTIAEQWLGKEASERSFIASPSFSYFGPLNQDVKEISILAPLSPGALKGAIVFPPNRYFCDAYGAAFLIHIHNALCENGWMALPFYSDKKAALTNFWSLSWLKGIFGKPKKILENPEMALFKRRETLPLPTSVLSFFLLEGEKYAKDIYQGKISENLDLPSLEQFYSNINYSVTGIGYKTQALRCLMDRYLSQKKDIRVLDIGGGCGFVGIELLLSEKRVGHVVNCELISENLLFSDRLTQYFKTILKDRYKFCLSPVQEYPFHESLDMVSAFGSLLYVPRKYLQETLTRAWKALNPGGILIVHENIKRPCFEAKNYYQEMFDVQELEEQLKRFGKIDYYRSSDIQTISHEKIKDLTVFRVIQKVE